MIIDIKNQINYTLVKGEIHILRANPWVRPFLKYIQKNPTATETDICRELFCDNGNARKAAVKNILFFFSQQGFIESNKENGLLLTQSGLEALDTSNIWQGLKGVFQLTLWTPKADYTPYILDVQPVPDRWYDNGKYGLVEFPEKYGENICNLPLCPSNVKLDIIGKQGRPTIAEMEINTDIMRNGKITISGSYMNQGMKPFEVSFNVVDEVADYLLN